MPEWVLVSVEADLTALLIRTCVRGQQSPRLLKTATPIATGELQFLAAALITQKLFLTLGATIFGGCSDNADFS